jgi:hypothetical protein
MLRSKPPLPRSATCAPCTENRTTDYWAIEPVGIDAIIEPVAATPAFTDADGAGAEAAMAPDATTPAFTAADGVAAEAAMAPCAAVPAATPAATLAEFTFPVVPLREAMRAFLVAARLLIKDFFFMTLSPKVIFVFPVSQLSLPSAHAMPNIVEHKSRE